MDSLSNLWWQSFRHPSARNKPSKLLSYPADIKMRDFEAFEAYQKSLCYSFPTPRYNNQSEVEQSYDKHWLKYWMALDVLCA